MSPLTFKPPAPLTGGAKHHAAAAIGNVDVTTQAIGALQERLDGETAYERILLKAAAGAGKSYALKRMVADAAAHSECSRIGVTAFTNKQVFALAPGIGRLLNRDEVCLIASKNRIADVADETRAACTVVQSYKDVPDSARVILATTHMFEAVGWRMRGSLGFAHCGDRLFDVLFVDEAWQLAQHRYAKVVGLAPVVVGVGDVGQLPPLDSSSNPWRGDPGHNPYRAWPTAYRPGETTWAEELPAVWRPCAEQLGLWRSFYDEWDALDCVAAPGDRSVGLGPGLQGVAREVWEQVATGVPTLIEVTDLAEPEAPDVDAPLLSVLESLLAELLATRFSVSGQLYDDHGVPARELETNFETVGDDPLIAVLATRNAAVDDATEMVERLVEQYKLPDGVIVASTVDSWQGQTNAITVALHPLSGAAELDEFNSAFGRLAVTCTRATHGLLVLAREGLDAVLEVAPARPGTPFGEPGTRRLPRQTHRRILASFARATVSAAAVGAGVDVPTFEVPAGVAPITHQAVAKALEDG